MAKRDKVSGDFPYEQQACTKMPKSCMVWPCTKYPNDAELVEDDKGFMVCKRCGRSYGKMTKANTLVVSCVPCNKRVELPIDDLVLTFHVQGMHGCYPTETFTKRTIRLNNFIAYPHILCKDCLGAATIEVI